MAEYTQNYNLEKQQENDYVNIEGINDNFNIIDSELKKTWDKADQAFQSASNGKAAIKAAITGVDPDVTVPTNATFAQLATAIGQIQTGIDTENATAKAEQILDGMTAYVKGAKVSGTMTNCGAVNITPVTSNQAIPKGYHDGNGIVAGDPDLISLNIRAGVNIFGVNGSTNTVETSAGDIVAGDVLAGKKGYAKGNIITGAIPIINPVYGDQIDRLDVSVGAHSGDGLNYAYLGIPNRSYLNGINWVRRLEPDLVSPNILAGKSIMGVPGSAIAGKRFASGTYAMTAAGATFYYQTGAKVSDNYPYIIVSGLTFTPTFIHIVCFQWNGVYEYVTQYTTITGNGTVEPSFKLSFYDKDSFSANCQNISALKGAAYVNSNGFCAPVSLGDVGTICYWYAYE